MKIGIPATQSKIHSSKEMWGINSEYFDFVALFGTPILLSPTKTVEEFFDIYGNIDGLILPGGEDVNPFRYTWWRKKETGGQNQFFEYFDTYILPHFVEFKNFPIFGICRGLQTLNVYFGGTLHQHLENHPVSNSQKSLVHEVYLEPRKQVKEADAEKFSVNSYHHQGIKRLGRGLEPLATTKDRLIEAFMHREKPIAAVQWHPERNLDVLTVKLIKQLFDVEI